MLFTNHHKSDDAALEHAASLSPHLSRLFKIFSDDYAQICARDFETIITAADDDLTNAISLTRDDANLMAAIRHYRGRINHLVAVTDFLNLADITAHMTWLTHAAEHALKTLTRHLAGDDDENWFILALGKMGAGELNYSSDIDLIIVTLHDQSDYTKSKYFINLTRRIINIMSSPTKDGIGWRVDLRLRPDPGATPIAIHLNVAMIYYESMARTWERAAFIRARPVAGNISAGQHFLDDLSPFIWRRYLDYTVLEDLKVMLRRESRDKELLGYNIKNGIGGIRSIEFFVHAQQLIAGGREPLLRKRITNHALEALTHNHWISNEAAEQLKTAYLTWRRLEHRLQMIGDAQTHALPKSDEGLTNLASFCGMADLTAFKQLIIDLGDTTHRETKGLMERLEQGQAPDQKGSDNTQQSYVNLSWDDDNTEQSQTMLKSLGYDNPETIIFTVQGWLAGRVLATRSPRARDLLSQMLPRLMTTLAETGHPDTSFAAFARLVEKLPAGLQLFSLMETHQNIAEMIIGIVTSAPKLADIISNHPALADSLLYRSFWQPEQNWPACENDLNKVMADINDYEEMLLTLRRYCREWQFRTSVQLLQQQLKPVNAGRDFAAIADIIIRAAMSAVSLNIRKRFGHIKDSGMTVLALGRLGAEEMTLLSDLDLIFIYDGPQDAQSQDGARSVHIGQYYSRFGQELINALSALTSEGRCYDIDMRLRPSGNKGPVAVHLDTFLSYQDNEAWTWEHMALIKSRVISHFGDRSLKHILEEKIPTFIKKNRASETVIDDVASMRDRLKNTSQKTSLLDIRSSDGGIMDIDFLTQMMQMMPAAITLPVFRRAYDSAQPLADAGLITKDDAEAIRKASHLYSDAIQLMRLLDMSPNDQKDKKDSLPAILKKRFGINSFGQFSALFEETSKPVSNLMKKYVCKVEKRE